MQLEIHTDIFTQRVLSHTYQVSKNNPLDFTRHPEFLNLVILLSKIFDNKPDLVREDIKEPLQILLPNELSEPCCRIPVRIALKMKTHARKIFFDYMLASYYLGKEQQTSCFEFCKQCGIAIDIDVTFDALIKSWKRFFFEKKKEIISTYMYMAGHRKGNEKQTEFKDLSKHSDEQLEVLIQQYIQDNLLLFYLKRDPTQPYRLQLEKSLRAYVFTILGQRRGIYVAKKLKISARNVNYQKKSFKIFLQTAPPIGLSKEQVAF